MGFNINAPLPAGSGGGAYLDIMDRLVSPALEQFKPDLIIGACGFDASFYDPTGHMLLGSQHYRLMTERLKSMAAKLCDGRLLLAHEGGYSEVYVPFCGVAVVEALRGERSTVFDPFEAMIEAMPGQALQDWQRKTIDAYLDDSLSALSQGLGR